jgi:general stress protein 26
MAKKTTTDDDARQQLWTQLEKGRVSMLWVRNSPQHPQPMTHFPDREAGVLWFISSSETDLVAETGAGADAALTFVSDGQDYHASFEGRLEVVRDDAKLDELWTTAAAAWFEDGREDPKVRLLRFTAHEAAIWASQSSMILVGLKLLRAGMTEGADHPDVGVHRVIDLKTAA